MNTPTSDDVALVARYVEETGKPAEGPEFVAWIRANYPIDIDKGWTDHGSACWTKVVTIENHKYIILSGTRFGSIVHAASCECMNGH